LQIVLAGAKIGKFPLSTEEGPLVKAIAWVLLFLVMTARSAIADCLDEATIFARNICGEISSRGSSRLVTSSGELNAEARGLLRSLLGSAGGELRGETQFNAYENVLREQLGPELVNVRDCRIKMAEAAIKQACERPEKSGKIEQNSYGNNSPNIITRGNVDFHGR
jgi:hypothetical protein